MTDAACCVAVLIQDHTVAATTTSTSLRVQGHSAHDTTSVDVTRVKFLLTLLGEAEAALAEGAGRCEVFRRCYVALAPRYGSWPILEHTIPFDVARVIGELRGIEHPTI